MLIQSVSVFSLVVFVWALLPEIKWVMMMTSVRTRVARLCSAAYTGRPQMTLPRSRRTYDLPAGAAIARLRRRQALTEAID